MRPSHPRAQAAPAGSPSLNTPHSRLTARAQERAKGTAKGGDFEDLLEGLLAEGARGAGDLLERTGNEAGAILKSKKGDFVLTVINFKTSPSTGPKYELQQHSH
jgi:hypothetical protein